MHTSDFNYYLPKELIAQEPVSIRDQSRLMILDRQNTDIKHRHFFQLTDFLYPGDVLVLNDTRVLPARLYAHRIDTGGRYEFLLIQQLGQGLWKAIGKPSKRLRSGLRFKVGLDNVECMELQVLESHEDGVKIVRLSPENALERVGDLPLPPYIASPIKEPARYQTIYANNSGSVAAPTAGLHFTEDLLTSLGEKGVRLVFCTLHIGIDTFRPVKSEDPYKHVLHREYFSIGTEAALEINAARREGRRIVAVGTTVVRLLEQVALSCSGEELDNISPMSDWANIMILPGHEFRLVDALVTNFHLPRSTLLMMVSALAGRERILSVYQEAIDQRYRFYSFGDAMLIL